jgi:hypothetical protein
MTVLPEAEVSCSRCGFRTRMVSLVLVLGLVVVGLFSACTNLYDMAESDGPIAQAGSLGSIIVSIGDSLGASSSVVPDVEMEIDSYQIRVSGAGDTQETTVDATNTTATFDELAPGEWTVTVNARNSGGVIIASDTVTVTVVADETAEASVVVVPLTGEGTLDISISWEAGSIDDPSIVATLKPSGGSGSDLSSAFVIDTDENKTTYSGSWAAGYYELTLSLKDGDDTVWPLVVAVRIIEGAVSSGEYSLEESDLVTGEDEAEPSGSIQVKIGADLQNPYTITLSGVEASLGHDESMTVEMSLDPPTDPDEIKWYLNGEVLPEETSGTLVIGPSGVNATPGTYRLSVTVEHGTILGSAHVDFVIESAPSSNAQLSALLLSTGALEPMFEPAITEYTVEVSHSVGDITVEGVPADAEVATVSYDPPQPVVLDTGTNEITITVTAGDGTTTVNYVVNVTRTLSSEKSITIFRITDPLVEGSISEPDRAIELVVPREVDRSSLSPVIQHTGASVSPPSEQARDFSNPVEYVVSAQDGSIQTYTVTISPEPIPPPVITVTGSSHPDGDGAWQTLTIVSDLAGASIRYTTDGSEPTSTHGMVYSSYFSVYESLSIRAVAIMGEEVSPVASVNTNIWRVTKPSLALQTWSNSAEFNCHTPGAHIRYTTDGTTPSPTNGTLISPGTSFPLYSGTRVKAIAYKDGLTPSSMLDYTR